MIPSIEQILADLAEGSITREQALAWINTHIELAEGEAQGSARDGFAAAAMQGMLADMPKALYGLEWKTNLAVAAYEVADAMLAARSPA